MKGRKTPLSGMKKQHLILRLRRDTKIMMKIMKKVRKEGKFRILKKTMIVTTTVATSSAPPQTRPGEPILQENLIAVTLYDTLILILLRKNFFHSKPMMSLLFYPVRELQGWKIAMTATGVKGFVPGNYRKYISDAASVNPNSGNLKGFFTEQLSSNKSNHNPSTTTNS